MFLLVSYNAGVPFVAIIYFISYILWNLISLFYLRAFLRRLFAAPLPLNCARQAGRSTGRALLSLVLQRVRTPHGRNADACELRRSSPAVAHRSARHWICAGAALAAVPPPLLSHTATLAGLEKPREKDEKIRRREGGREAASFPSQRHAQAHRRSSRVLTGDPGHHLLAGSVCFASFGI